MQIGLLFERKADYQFLEGDPSDCNSELLSAKEERELIDGLEAAGYRVIPIGDTTALLARLDYWRQHCDLVLNRSVGYRGAERKSFAPAILEAAGIPYIGSTPYVLSLTRNKYHAKLVARDAGLPTPRAALVAPGIETRLDGLPYPAIVKPVAESSSIGIEQGKAVVATPAAARQRAELLARRYAQPALVETFVDGIELEVPILVDPEPRVLGILAVTVNGRLPDGSHYLATEEVYNDGYDYADPPEHIDRAYVADLALRGARALGIRDYGRLDFRVDADGTPWFIEASTHPHIQQLSSFYRLAQRQGLSYPAMLDMLVQSAARRYGV